MAKKKKKKQLASVCYIFSLPNAGPYSVRSLIVLARPNNMNPSVELDTKCLLNVCRFCLHKRNAMQLRSPAELQLTDIPVLYETITGLKLEPSPDCASFVCCQCDSNLRLAHQIRSEFVQADRFWKNHIASLASKSSAAFDVAKGCADAVALPQLKSEHVCMSDDGSVGRADEKNTNPNWDSSGDHVESERNERRTALLECDICGHTMDKKRHLLKHMTQHRKALNIDGTAAQRSCHICGKTNLKCLTKHLNDHRRRADACFRCSYCQRSFSRNDDLLQHERIHTGERPFVCEMCAFSFTSSSGLNRHRKLRHLNGDQLQSKRYSNSVVQVIPALAPAQPAIILGRKAPKKPLPKLVCPVCSGAFVNRVSLYQHMRLLHQPDGRAVYKQFLSVTCTLCNRTFGTTGELAVHKVVHYHHVCGICSRGFDNAKALEYHAQRHSKKERKYKCELCAATFVTGYNLKQHHKHAHSTERPHVCDFCSRGFVESYELNMHVRMVHSETRPHQCADCPKAYKSVSLLRYHQQQHTGKFRYQCSICHKPCSTGPLLTQHMRDYHPDA